MDLDSLHQQQEHGFPADFLDNLQSTCALQYNKLQHRRSTRQLTKTLQMYQLGYIPFDGNRGKDLIFAHLERIRNTPAQPEGPVSPAEVTHEDRNSFLSKVHLRSAEYDSFGEMLPDRLLWRLIVESRHCSVNSKAGANAISILNHKKMSFSALDLHDIKIAGADLHRSIFHNSNLTNCVLDGCNFSGSYLAGATIDGSSCKDTRWGELPNLNWASGKVCALAFHHDSKMLYAVGDGGTSTFSVETHKLLNSNNGNDARAVSVSSKGDYVVGYSNGAVELFLAGADVAVKVLLQEGYSISSGSQQPVDFSPDGLSIVWMRGKQLCSYNLATTEKTIIELRNVGISSRAIRFAPNGSVLAVAGDGSTWNAGSEIKFFNCPNIRHLGAEDVRSVHGTCFAFSSTSELVAVSDCTTGESRIRFLSVADLTERLPSVRGHNKERHAEGIGTTCMSFSPATEGGSVMATGGEEGIIKLWLLGTESAHLVRQFFGHTAPVLCLAFSADGSTVASGTGYHMLEGLTSGDRTIRLWETFFNDVGAENASFESFSILAGLAYDSVTQQNICVDETGRINVFSRRMEMISSLELPARAEEVIQVSAVSFLASTHELYLLLDATLKPGTAAFASASRLRRSPSFVDVWCTKSHRSLRRLINPHEDYRTMCVLSEDCFVLANTKSFAVYSTDTGSLLRDVEFPTGIRDVIQIRVVQASGLGMFGVALGRDILLYEVATSALKTHFCDAHASTARSLVFLSNGAQVVSVGDDRMVRLWAVATLDSKLISHSSAAFAHEDVVFAVNATKSEQFLVTGDAKGYIIIWNLESRKALYKVLAQTSAIDSIVFTSAATFVSVARKDVKLWRIQNDEVCLFSRTDQELVVSNMKMNDITGARESDRSVLLQKGATMPEKDAARMDFMLDMCASGMRTNSYDQAITLIKMELVGNPYHKRALLLLGFAQFKSGAFKDALATLDSLITSDEQCYEAYYFRAKVNMALSEASPAYDDIKRAFRFAEQQRHRRSPPADASRSWVPRPEEVSFQQVRDQRTEMCLTLSVDITTSKVRKYFNKGVTERSLTPSVLDRLGALNQALGKYRGVLQLVGPVTSADPPLSAEHLHRSPHELARPIVCTLSAQPARSARCALHTALSSTVTAMHYHYLLGDGPVILGFADGTISSFKLTDGSIVHIVGEHIGAVTSLCSLNHSVVAAGGNHFESRDFAVRGWDSGGVGRVLALSDCVVNFIDTWSHKQWLIMDCQFYNYGKDFVRGVIEKCQIHCYEPRTAKCVQCIYTPFYKISGLVVDNAQDTLFVSYAGDGSSLSEYSYLQAWNLINGQVLRRFHHDQPIQSIKMNMNCTYLAMNSRDTVYLWDLDEFECSELTLPAFEVNKYTAATFTVDDKYLLVSTNTASAGNRRHYSLLLVALTKERRLMRCTAEVLNLDAFISPEDIIDPESRLQYEQFKFSLRSELIFAGLRTLQTFQLGLPTPVLQYL